MPPRLSGKNAKRDGLIYAVRVDILPNAKRWLAMSLNDLYRAYCIARDKGGLPAANIAVASTASSTPAQRRLGHREKRMNRPWAGMPTEPWPTVDDLDRRANRRDEHGGASTPPSRK